MTPEETNEFEEEKLAKLQNEADDRDTVEEYNEDQD